MKKKTVLAIIGASIGILIGMLVVINIPGVRPATNADVQSTQETEETQGTEEKNLLSKTGNTVLEDEHSVTEIATGEYIEDQVEEETTTGSASENTVLNENDMSYVANKNEILDPTRDRAYTNYYAAADTDVYAEMSVDSEILGRVNMNDVLKSYGNVDGWYVIDYNGRDGFIPAQYISPSRVTDSESTIVLNENNGMTNKQENQASSKENTKQTTEPEKEQSKPTNPAQDTEQPSSGGNSNSGTITNEELSELDKIFEKMAEDGSISLGIETDLGTPAPEHVMTPEEEAYLRSLDMEIH